MDCGHQRTVSRDKVQRSASSSLYFCSQCIFHSFDSILGICKLVYMDIFLIFWDSWSLFCICVHVRLNLDPSYIQIMRQNLLYDIYIYTMKVTWRNFFSMYFRLIWFNLYTRFCTFFTKFGAFLWRHCNTQLLFSICIFLYFSYLPTRRFMFSLLPGCLLQKLLNRFPQNSLEWWDMSQKGIH